MTGNRIDVHAHYLGGTVAQLINDAGVPMASNYKMPAQLTAEAALAHMDRHQIAAQILSTPWAATGSEPQGFATRFCRGINQECAQLIEKYPGRFGAFTAVPLDNAEAALAEIAHGLDELALDGVILTSNSLGRYFGHPFFEPILAELNRRRVPVFVHPSEPPHIDELGFGCPLRWWNSRSTPPAPSPTPSTAGCSNATRT
jgi:predicted TIM-barrel fold metal-dependent hydrolase